MNRCDQAYRCIVSPVFFYLLGATLFCAGWAIFIYTMIWSNNYYTLFIAPVRQKSTTRSPTLEVLSNTFPLSLRHASAGVLISLVYALLPFQPKHGDNHKVYRARSTARYVFIIVVLSLGMGIGCVPLFLVNTLPWSADEFDASVISAAMSGPQGIFYQCTTLVLGVLAILGGQHLTHNAGTVKLHEDEGSFVF